MRFALLGPLGVYEGDGRPVAVTAGKQRAVLAALLLRGNRVVSSGTLIGSLWDEDAPSSARASLLNYVARLRRALGPEAAARLQTVTGGYRLRIADDAEVDHLQASLLESRARTCATAGDWGGAERLTGQALALWRGDPLEDIPPSRLHTAHLQGLEDLRLRLQELGVDACLCRSRFDRALPLLAELTHQHPLRETLHERRFLALYAAGHRAEALALFRHVRALLREELGVEPSPSMRELHQLALREVPPRELLAASAVGPLSPAPAGATAPAGPFEQAEGFWPLGSQLPAVPRLVAGRDAELLDLTSLLAGPDTTPAGGVALLVGPAGVGKTTLALAWAHRAAAWFPDGRLYLDLNGFAATGEPMAADSAVRVLLDCIGVPAGNLPATPEGRIAMYRSLIAGKRLLLVLDNARDADQVRPLLPPDRTCRALVTSRQTLASLAAREGAAVIALAPLSEAGAHELLTARLGAERTAGQEEAVRLIAAHCGRLPLALVVAAARAASLPGVALEALAAELSTRQLGGQPMASIRAVFSWSYRQLAPEPARVFRLLGLHPALDISLAAAASAAGLDRQAAGLVLAELCAMNLISEHIPGRYSLHCLLHAFAAELAAASTDAVRMEASRRLLDYYLQTSVAANCAIATYPLPDKPDPAEAAPGVTPDRFDGPDSAAAWFRAESAVLDRVITDAAASGFDTYVWQLVCARAVSKSNAGQWRENVEWGALALAAARLLGDRAAQGHAHLMIGRELARLGECGSGFEHLRCALELFKNEGSIRELSQTHRALGNGFGAAGDFGSAIEHMRHYLNFTHATGHRLGEAMALNSMGWLLAKLGQEGQALEYCRRSVDLLKAAGGHRASEGHVWDTLGFIHYRLGEHEDAIAWYRAAAASFDAVGNKYQQALAYQRAGDVHVAVGDVASARTAWLSALEIFRNQDRDEAGQVEASLRLLDGQI